MGIGKVDTFEEISKLGNIEKVGNFGNWKIFNIAKIIR